MRHLPRLALALGIVLASAAPASARPALEPKLVVTADAKLRTVRVELESAPGASCRLRVSEEGWPRTFVQRRMNAAGTRVWQISAPSPPAVAPWTFYATCRLGSSHYWRRLVTELGFPVNGGALVSGVAPAAPAASCDDQGVCFADDPIEVGQCGWYALGRRPDTLPYAEHTYRAGELLAAAAGHLSEGAKPEVGALAIWSIASDPPDGHVGYVAAVNGADVLIDDSNWRPTPTSPGLQVHEHWVRAAEPAGYIYGP